MQTYVTLCVAPYCGSMSPVPHPSHPLIFHPPILASFHPRIFPAMRTVRVADINQCNIERFRTS